jgi:hypothetical protein
VGEEQHYWVFLFEDLISQEDPIKQWARIGPVEDALASRLQELEGGPACREEPLAISKASGRLLEIKRLLLNRLQSTVKRNLTLPDSDSPDSGSRRNRR